jgi:3-hydroxyisobutyrate dehydrogenase-like beta-hydroxyacid dehydrogenase
MGAAVAAQITINGHIVLWCPDGRSTATLRRAEDAGLRPAPLDELLADSAVVLSICPPAVAEEIASTVAGIGYRGIYVEANAISPTGMHRITTRLSGARTTVVDGCIFGSPFGGQLPARFYLAGDATAACQVADLFTGSLVEPVILGQHPARPVR